MFSDFPQQDSVTQLLQRSLERNRLAHAYLFSGNSLKQLEDMARTLAKALNCQSSTRRAANQLPLDSCDACDSCRRIDQSNHPDILWVRPESKLRIIGIDQIRELMHMVNLKPTAARFKVGIIVAADRLTSQAANAFLKTLEEPPASSVLILLSTEPQRLLDTIISRCLRLSFGGDGTQFDAAHMAWLAAFSASAAAGGKQGLLGHYRLLGLVAKKLAEQRAAIEENLTANSPLEKYDELEAGAREKLEDELSAAIEAEYRRQRTELIAALQWWLRDVWLHTLDTKAGLLAFPALSGAATEVAARITSADATKNLDEIDHLQRLLHSNVQEALALEVAFLKLKL
jgi:DNA polymerase-3 subunit delta'